MTKSELLEIAKPILFNTEMVQAILEGRKTVTRRLVKPKYKKDEGGFQVCTNKATGERWIEKHDWDEGSFDNPRYVNPPYRKGDILYVRETWMGTGARFYYKADGKHHKLDNLIGDKPFFKWKPSIHMPKNLARIFLKVTDVRVERLKDITEAEAKAEGIRSYFLHKEHGGEWREFKYFFMGADWSAHQTRKKAFANLWNSTIKKQDLDRYGWESNPWVWVYEFERIEI